jgi:hypothetical protein
MANEGTRYNRKNTRKGQIRKGAAISLTQHLEDLKLANTSYLKDTGKSEFNIKSGEGSPGLQTEAGQALLEKSKQYYFRNPGRNRAEREAERKAGRATPIYPKQEKMEKGRERITSGDIKISKRRQTFEDAIAPRLEKVEQEYAASKAAKLGGQVRINKK